MSAINVFRRFFTWIFFSPCIQIICKLLLQNLHLHQLLKPFHRITFQKITLITLIINDALLFSAKKYNGIPLIYFSIEHLKKYNVGR